MTTLIPAATLVLLFDAAGLTPELLVRSMLRCTLVDDEDGSALAWANAGDFTVGDLVTASLRTAPARAPLLGLKVAGFEVAERVIPLMLDRGLVSLDELQRTRAQVEALLTATQLFLEPHFEHSVEAYLKKPDINGFYRGCTFSSVEHVDELFRQTAAAYGQKNAKLMASRPLKEGLQLHAWAVTKHGLDGHSASVRDICVLLVDGQGSLAGCADLLRVDLGTCSEPSDLEEALTCYGQTSARLAERLQATAQGTGRLSLRAAQGLIHLEHVELRKDLRGRGLGAALLREALTEISRQPGAPVGTLTWSAQPAQFDYPLEGLTPDVYLEALDAAETLGEHLRNAQLHRSVISSVPVQTMELACLPENA